MSRGGNRKKKLSFVRPRTRKFDRIFVRSAQRNLTLIFAEEFRPYKKWPNYKKWPYKEQPNYDPDLQVFRTYLIVSWSRFLCRKILRSTSSVFLFSRRSLFRPTFMSSKNRRTTAFGFASGKFLENRASVFQEMRNTKNRKTRKTPGVNNQKLKKWFFLLRSTVRFTHVSWFCDFVTQGRAATPDWSSWKTTSWPVSDFVFLFHVVLLIRQNYSI